MIKPNQIKKFENHETTMSMRDLLAFAKYGFICYQILEKQKLFHQRGEKP